MFFTYIYVWGKCDGGIFPRDIFSSLSSNEEKHLHVDSHSESVPNIFAPMSFEDNRFCSFGNNIAIL